MRICETLVIPALLQTEKRATDVISLSDYPLVQAERLAVLRNERHAASARAS